MRPKRSIAAATPSRTAASSRTSAWAVTHAAPSGSSSAARTAELVLRGHRVAGVLELLRDVEADDVVALAREGERGDPPLTASSTGDEGDRPHATCSLRYGSR